MTALTDEAREELSNLCKSRASLYGLLSRLYCEEVDEELLKDLRGTAFPARTGNELVDTGYRKIATYLSGNAYNAIQELAVDYVNTFMGHGNLTYSAAYPFESVYTSEKRLLMQEARDDVIAAYKEANFTIGRRWKEPEDHLAVELLYMQRQAERAHAALEAGDEEEAQLALSQQHDFFFNHLAAWSPMLTTDMKRVAKTEFYKGLAFLTEGFIQVDRSFLASIFS